MVTRETNKNLQTYRANVSCCILRSRFNVCAFLVNRLLKCYRRYIL